MADYAYLNTSRYSVKYQNNGEQHTQIMRFEREQGVPPSGAQLEAITSFWNAIAPVLCTDFAFIEATWYNADQRVGVPAVTPGVVSGIPILNVPSVPTKPQQINFVGKSLGGSKARFMVVGVYGDGPGGVFTNYRITPSEAVWFSAARLLLQGIPGLVAVDNQAVVWSNYANFKVHDYWVKQVR